MVVASRVFVVVPCLVVLFSPAPVRPLEPPKQPAATGRGDRQPPPELAPFFRPADPYRSDYGRFRSPLRFADGTEAKTSSRAHCWCYRPHVGNGPGAYRSARGRSDRESPCEGRSP